jgi:hypothetical protein
MGDREKVEIVKAVENYEKEARENFNNKEKQYINRETIKNIISELKKVCKYKCVTTWLK